MTRQTLRVLTLLVAWGASPAHGQWATWDIGTSPAPPLATRTALGFSVPHADGSIDGAWHRWVVGTVESRWLRRGPLFLGVVLEGAGVGQADGRDTTLGYGAAALEAGLGEGRARAWLRIGAGRLWDAYGPRSLSLGGLGGSVRAGRVTFELAVMGARVPPTYAQGITVDTLGVPLQAPARFEQWVPGRAWRELRGRISWGSGPMALQLAGGATSGSVRSRWVQVTAARWLTPGIALLAAAGNPPIPVVEVRRPTALVTLGLRIAVGRSGATRATAPHEGGGQREFQVLPSGDQVRSVRVRVPGARSVELTADFVEWHVVELLAMGNDMWATSLPITQGIHYVSLRVNGGPWEAPPGLPRVTDDFGGSTGLLHVH
jgi:hypothetical protein